MNSNRKTSLRKLSMALSWVLMASCGGGILGSGTGGGSGSPDTPNPPPTEEKYNIEFLPLQLSAAIPASLSQQTEDKDWFDNEQPQQTVISGVGEFIDNKITMGLAQLYIDAGWESITTYCTSLPDTGPCTLENSGLSILYTKSMALWEIELRTNIEHEKLGLSSEQSMESLDAITSLVNAKIGSQIQLDSVILETTLDEEYDYRVTISIGEISPATCTLNWDNRKQLVLSSVTTQSDLNETDFFQTNYDNSTGIPSNKYLFNRTNSTSELEVELNLQTISGSEDFFVESNITEITGTESKTIYSRGRAGAETGYLRSEASSTIADATTTVLHREVFNTFPISAATCNPLNNTSYCREESDWSTILGNNPVTFDQFLTFNELNELDTRSGPHIVTISNISNNAYAFSLLDSTKIEVDEVNQEIQFFSLPGWGPISWPFDLFAFFNQGNPDAEEQAELLRQAYDDSSLCRFDQNNSTISADALTTQCHAHERDIRRAYVVSESATNGVLIINHEASAIISIAD